MTHVQEDKWTIQKGKTQREHQVLKPPSVVTSILNNEMEGPLERIMRSLDKSSPIATTCFKIKITYACYNIIDTLCL
jgi:hypothetical protein